MKHLIDRIGLPTPPAIKLDDAESPRHAVEMLGWPLVVKPVDLGGGIGVTANIRSFAQLEAAVGRARQRTRRPILIERHVSGLDYRLMVIDGRVVTAVHRTAASVTGDGVRTVQALVDALNAERSRDLRSRLYLTQIAIDALALEQLAIQGLALSSVPAAGKTVQLRSTANRSTGGSCIDVTAIVHPEVAEGAVAICETAGLRCAGVDYLGENIALPLSAGRGTFIEVNTTPGLAVIAAAGIDAVAIASEILGDVGRVPVTLVVAPETEYPALEEALRGRGPAAGDSWACGRLARFDGRDAVIGRRTAQDRAAMLLTCRRTQRATLVCSAAELTCEGLPFDRLDRAILCEAPPPQWQALVERHSAQVVYASVEDAARLLGAN